MFGERFRRQGHTHSNPARSPNHSSHEYSHIISLNASLNGEKRPNCDEENRVRIRNCNKPASHCKSELIRSWRDNMQVPKLYTTSYYKSTF
jgi:hypothetical protein